MYITDSTGRQIPFSSGKVTVLLYFKTNMSEVSFPTCDEYEACLYSGSRIPVYSGTRIQRGYGVGGLFRRLASGLLSLLPRIEKSIASTALRVASDKMRGVPLYEALKKHGLETGKKMLFNRKPVKRKQLRGVPSQ